MEWREYKDRAAVFVGLADQVADELRAALDVRGRAALAVPGGTTPRPFFEALRVKDLDWGAVSVALTDERFVPESSDRSNTALLRDGLLQDRAAAAQLVQMRADGDAPEDVLDGLIGGVEAMLPLDVCVLGMGADMHTASLFPGADQLELGLRADAPALLAMRAPGAPEPRITMTAPVLQGAGAVHILIVGAEKKAALAAARDAESIAEAPVKLVLEQAVVHYAD